MRILGRVELRCHEHESFQANCPACGFLRKAEQDLIPLRNRRDCIFRQLKQHLASRDLIIIDLR